MKSAKPTVSLAESLGILVALLAIFGYLIIDQKLTPHIPILFALVLLLLYGKWKGFSRDETHEGIMRGIKSGTIPIIIFLLIGISVAIWILSETIPTIMAYGFKIISVKFFLPTVFVVCALVGVTVRSPFATVLTMGIAFLGIGHVFGFDNATTAGVIVSGTLSGNNISSLSGTTNLAAGIGGVNLFEHMLSMTYTIIPTFIISIVGYIFLGYQFGLTNLQSVDVMIQTLHRGFWISPITLLLVVVLFLFARRKVPVIPMLLVGSTVAAVLAFINDRHLSLVKVFTISMSNYMADTGNRSVDTLLSRGGIESMLGSAVSIILTLGLGGLLIKFNIVTTLIDEIEGYMNNPAKLITLTALNSMGINLLVGRQYLSVILLGEAFKSSFTRLDIDKKYLARTLVDAGAAVNSLIPWRVSGTSIMGMLEVGVLEYLPYAFFSLPCPITTVILGIFLKKQRGENKKAPGTNVGL